MNLLCELGGSKFEWTVKFLDCFVVALDVFHLSGILYLRERFTRTRPEITHLAE